MAEATPKINVQNGKDHEAWFQKRLMLGDMIYAHKEKALNWVKAIQQHESLGRLTIQDSSFSRIPSYEDLVKAREVHSGFYQRAGAEERLAEDEAAWNDLIDRYRAADKTEWKNKQDGTLFHVMDVPLVMQLLHIPHDQLHVFGSFFAHAVNQKHKGMTLELLRQLPRKMADPLMIARGNKPNSYVFVVDLKDTNGATIIVPVEINKKANSSGAIANIINTAFGKTVSKTDDSPSFKWFEKQFKRNTVLYLNKKKSTAWLQAYRNSSPAVIATSNALSAFIVSNAF